MAAMSPEAQALGVLQQEMAETRAHVSQLTNFYEALKSAHDALNLVAQQALAYKEQKIQESENRLQSLIFRQQLDLLDSKEPKPDHLRRGARRCSAAAAAAAAAAATADPPDPGEVADHSDQPCPVQGGTPGCSQQAETGERERERGREGKK